MKKLFFFLVLLISAQSLFAQQNLDSLYKEGIKMHDEGKYEKAIELYNQGLKLDPGSPTLYYEISYSYFEMGEYKKSIPYSDKVLESGNAPAGLKRMAAVTKGSSLDYLGLQKESTEFFEDFLKNNEPDYLLYFNLGIVYNKMKEYKKAEDVFLKAINLKRDHPVSHYMLGVVSYNTNKKCLCMMSMYYFLLLEPDTKRSKDAFDILKKADKSFLKKDDKGTTIFVDPDITDASQIDFTYALKKTADFKHQDSLKAINELFFYDTEEFFTFLNTFKRLKFSGVWKDLYLPFFTDLLNSGHLEVFCNFIMMKSSKRAADWLENNVEKLRKFAEWLEKRSD